MVDRCGLAKGEAYATAEKLGHELLGSCHGVVGQPPLYKDGECASQRCIPVLMSISHFPHCTSPRSPRRVRSSILRSTKRICTSLRRTLKRWLAPIRFRVRSTFRRSKMTSSSSGTL
ncbi:hypothetical protein BC827DRAFT_1176161 [Russula dissimulans]|nr:hypothetical protein BC827DRAFT_1176161 [Russula dissimulans]